MMPSGIGSSISSPRTNVEEELVIPESLLNEIFLPSNTTVSFGLREFPIFALSSGKPNQIQKWSNFLALSTFRFNYQLMLDIRQNFHF